MVPELGANATSRYPTRTPSETGAGSFFPAERGVSSKTLRLDFGADEVAAVGATIAEGIHFAEIYQPLSPDHGIAREGMQSCVSDCLIAF